MGKLPTARDYLGVHHVDAVCSHCNRRQDLSLDTLIAAGLGDVPLVELPLRCSQCGQRGHKIIVSGRPYPLQGAE
jgi:hypothetical protein